MGLSEHYTAILNGNWKLTTLRGDTVVETRAALKVVRTRVKCLLIHSDRESNPFVVTTDTSCNFTSNRTILFVATLLQQRSRLLTAMSTLKESRVEKEVATSPPSRVWNNLFPATPTVVPFGVQQAWELAAYPRISVGKKKSVRPQKRKRSARIRM